MMVFLCGTFADLAREREAVRRVVEDLEHRHQAMEFFGARTDRPIETCLEEVRRSDVLIVVVGFLYGSLVPGQEISFTEAEYHEGQRTGKTCLVYVRGDDALVPRPYHERDPAKIVRLQRFCDTLAERHTIARFRDADELAHQVRLDLSLLAEKSTRSAPPEAIELSTREQGLARELEIAAEMQRQLLPAAAPNTTGFDIDGYSAPCRTIGGDYYDYIDYADGRVGLTIAEVAGKAIPAALLMTGLQARVRLLAEDRHAPAELMTRLNRSTSSNMPSNRFITLFFGVLNTRDGELVYSNAGHIPPMLARQDGSVERLSGGGVILGVIPSATYEEYRARLAPGDVLLLYTDGVSEAANPRGEEFEEDRLAAVLRESRDRSAQTTIEAIMRSVNDWSAGAPMADDLTVVVARRI
jgi:serine phosphatase RsbU (regulator of sigma subunit)